MIGRVLDKLAHKVAEQDLTFRFENIFDDETGAYDEDWENYSTDMGDLHLKAIRSVLDLSLIHI